VRILSATNKDLAERMRRGEFREDLYYRLNVVTIRLPPLRERGGDIGLLAQFFLKKFSGQMGKRLRGLAPEALELLSRYHWPGNIRELENTMERAVLMADGDQISAENLALGSPSGPQVSAPTGNAGGAQEAIMPSGSLQESERRLVLEALQACGWVQKEAARRLGLSSRALNYRIHKLGITHPGWRQNRG
jgi:DNA-binding NtrC family response regulator